MSDDESSIADRHRKEKKDLREKITAMKKAAKCGNKQKVKETNSECDRLEKELEKRHKDELAKVAEPEVSDKEEKAPLAVQEDANSDESPAKGYYKEVAVSKKAEKRRAKKEKQEKALQEAVKNIESVPALRVSEMEAVEKLLNVKKIDMYEIQADGDCMYNSIAHQLFLLGVDTTGKKLRQKCAEYMKDHMDDFLPFISDDNGEPLDAGGFEKYLEGVERMADKGGVWGGEIELNALSRVLKHVIEVIKTDGERRYGEEFDTEKMVPIRVVYLRNAYKLGEHYNSTKPSKL